MTLLEILPLAWPLVTAVASFAAHLIERRYPRAAALLRATGLDVPGAVRALRPPRLPEQSALRPSVPPPPPPRPVLPDVPDEGPVLAGPKPRRKRAAPVKR